MAVPSNNAKTFKRRRGDALAGPHAARPHTGRRVIENEQPAYLARRYTVSLLTPAGEVETSLSSSPVRLTEAFDSTLSLFGMRAISYFRTRVLSTSLTDQVPKLAANARAAAAYSASVEPKRRLLVSLNFGRLGCPCTTAYLPSASRLKMPFGFAPKSCRLAPVAGVVSLDTRIHDPTSCCLRLCALAEAASVSATAIPVVAEVNSVILLSFHSVTDTCVGQFMRRSTAGRLSLVEISELHEGKAC